MSMKKNQEQGKTGGKQGKEKEMKFACTCIPWRLRGGFGERFCPQGDTHA